ncbi:phytoene/squalene synthase family protein [Salinibacter ruber]|uniref:phytoene/squalene synthase family protein n=1 Tax=Salinibacter ruber TaxID=146919 RepID=UPI0021684208|nr:phytoene/squalene synthase family protein [Salinibacter ruber]MCS3610882.1 phytoene synthase [Salinibacter ruber]
MSTLSLDTRADEDEWIWESFRYHSRTFSLAAYLLPRSVQMSVATLYLYCRRVDSIADQRVLEVGRERALQEVRQVRDRLDETLAGRPPAETVLWRRLAEVHEQSSLPRGPMYELIEGALWDLEGRPVVSKADLIEYSNLVGGSVGAMMLPFLADPERHDELEPAARKLGIAMQITNIVRDVGEDIDELDRVYLPEHWLDEHNVLVEALRHGRVADGYPALLEAAMEAAEQRYVDSFEGVAALPFRSRYGIRAAARMYREIMNEVRANDYDNLGRRAYVSFRRKLFLLLYDGYERRKHRLTSDALSGP